MRGWGRTGHPYIASTDAMILCLGIEPTLPDLLKLKVHQEVGKKWKQFGTILLNDEKGSRLDSFCQAHNDPEDITLRILQEWLQGKGLPMNWETLISTLKNVELYHVADNIERAHVYKSSCVQLC